MDRCPACRARLQNQPVCPRCSADFSLAVGAETSARGHLAAAMRHLAAGDRDGARQALEQSQAMKRSEIGRLLGYLINRRHVESRENDAAEQADVIAGVSAAALLTMTARSA